MDKRKVFKFFPLLLTVTTIWDQINTTYYNFITLLNRQGLLATTAFPACFYPDVAGNYMLQLSVNDTCQVQQSVLSIPVECASPPTPQLTVSEHPLFNPAKETGYVSNAGGNTWNVQLSRLAPRRVFLDARGSQNYSNSQLSYYWAWAKPDPRADTLLSQVSIETPYASTSAVEISGAGQYHLYLTLHDGCDVSYLNFTLNAQCGEPANTLQTAVTVNSNGKNLNTFLLSMQQGDSQIQCSQNLWEFVNFTEASFTSSAIHLISSSISTLFMVLVLVYVI